MGFSRQEYWSGVPFPPPGELPDPGIEPGSSALQADSLPSEPPGKLDPTGEEMGILPVCVLTLQPLLFCSALVSVLFCFWLSQGTGHYLQDIVSYSTFSDFSFIICKMELLFKNWSIVDLQCCVSFRCTNGCYTHTPTHTHPHTHIFFRFFYLTDYYNILSTVPCAISRSLLLTYFIQSSECMLILNS